MTDGEIQLPGGDWTMGAPAVSLPDAWVGIMACAHTRDAPETAGAITTYRCARCGALFAVDASGRSIILHAGAGIVPQSRTAWELTAVIALARRAGGDLGA